MFVPAWSDDWQIRGVDRTDGRPSGVVVFGGQGADYPDVRTTDAASQQPLWVDVSNVLQASVSRGHLELPLAVIVTDREEEFMVAGQPVQFSVLTSATAWRITAVLGARILSAAGQGTLPEGLAFDVVTDLAGLPDSRFA